MKRLFVSACAAALFFTAMPALAQSGTPFSLGGTQPDAPPAGSFTVSDIRVDGLQRIIPGMPVQPQVLKVDERGMPVFPAAGQPGAAPAAPAGN